MQHQQDTIIARATPPGIGAISIVRISGSKALDLLDMLTRGKANNLQSHTVRLRKIWAGEEELDEALVAVFKAPKSFSGEDMVELYLHGSEFILSGLFGFLLSHGARMAEPGEFTMRAYLNGRMDLSQAEAVADLVASQSKASHHLAMNQLKGSVSRKMDALRASLLEFVALVELELDFGEEDVEFADRSRLAEMVGHLNQEVDHLLASFKSGSAIKDGIPVAIVGRPNAGKSTILNAVLQEERAIVTEIPGTTRDTIEEFFVFDGLKYKLIDTAGIRQAADKVEAIGIDRAFASLGKAQLVWLVYDAATDSPETIAEIYAQVASETEAEIWKIANKTDLGYTGDMGEAIPVSALHAQMEPLFDKLRKFGAGILSEASDTTITHLRHFEVLQNARRQLHAVVVALQNKQTSDILAFELRGAIAELGKITGEIDSEEILGEIFGKFCIGK